MNWITGGTKYPRQVSIKVYDFDSLSDEAKEVAREWWREHALDYEWWESVYDDAETIGLKITGFDLGRRQSIDAELTEGVNEICRRIIANHGKECRTYKTAMEWISNRRGNRRCTEHEGESAQESFRDSLAQDYWFMLRDEMEWLMSDEQVDESIQANEYTFRQNGKRSW